MEAGVSDSKRMILFDRLNVCGLNEVQYNLLKIISEEPVTGMKFSEILKKVNETISRNYDGGRLQLALTLIGKHIEESQENGIRFIRCTEPALKMLKEIDAPMKEKTPSLVESSIEASTEQSIPSNTEVAKAALPIRDRKRGYDQETRDMVLKFLKRGLKSKEVVEIFLVEKKQKISIPTVDNWKKVFIKTGLLVPIEEKKTDTICPDCGKECASPTGVFNHRKINCKATQKETPCPVCKRIFKSEWGYKVHISCIHPNYIAETYQKKREEEESVEKKAEEERKTIFSHLVHGETDASISSATGIDANTVQEVRTELKEEHSLTFLPKESMIMQTPTDERERMKVLSLEALFSEDPAEESSKALLCSTCEITRVLSDTIEGIRNAVTEQYCEYCIGNLKPEGDPWLAWHPRKDLKEAIEKVIKGEGI